jgi:hypothetical protein
LPFVVTTSNTSVWRQRLARLVLLVSLGATIATSAPPKWRVEETEWITLPSLTAADAVVVHAAVRYQSPRGTWPLRIEALAEPRLQAGSLLQEALFDEAEVRTSAADPNLFEVRCSSKLCEGIITLDVRVAGPLSAHDEDAGVVLPRFGLHAGVHGQREGGFFFDCGKQSSTDSDKAPSTLMVDVTIDPLEDVDVGDAGRPDAAAPTGGSTLGPLRTLDGGLE